MNNPFATLWPTPPELLVCTCAMDERMSRDALLARYGGWLSADEQQRLARFGREEPARMFLGGRILLRGVLGALAGCEPAAIGLGDNEWQKPLLCAPLDDWQFNLSHSHGWLALAVSRVGEVGVDIEWAGRTNPVEKLARRYFSQREQQWLHEAPEGEFRQRFFDIWTLKEAYIKAVGKGLAVTLEGFGFTERAGRLHYHYEHGEQPPVGVHAWLSRAMPERPLACVLLADLPAAPLPQCQQLTLDGQLLDTLAVSAAS